MIERVLCDTLSGFGADLGEDILEYMVECICEDPDEQEVQFQDCIGPFLMDENVVKTEEELLNLCRLIGQGLDAAAEGERADEVEKDVGFRKLTHAVKMGADAELDEQAKRLSNLHMMGGWQMEMMQREQEASDLMTATLTKNQVRVARACSS